MPKPNDLHHLAIATADIKTQIEFFSDVLGMELVALYWMHGADGCFHGFLKLHDAASVAFVQTPDNHKIPPEIGVTHAGNPAGSCAPGTMQHVALNVESEADLLAMRDRIRSRGIQVLGPLDHGMCKSIYFAGPENLMLELSTSAEAIDARQWIDPEVVALAGISAAELERYVHPPREAGKGGAVPQPPYDPAKPNPTMPEQRDALLAGRAGHRDAQPERAPGEDRAGGKKRARYRGLERRPRAHRLTRAIAGNGKSYNPGPEASWHVCQNDSPSGAFLDQ